jgi:hypothetical protein
VWQALWTPRNELDVTTVAYVTVRADRNGNTQRMPVKWTWGHVVTLIREDLKPLPTSQCGAVVFRGSEIGPCNLHITLISLTQLGMQHAAVCNQWGAVH